MLVAPPRLDRDGPNRMRRVGGAMVAANLARHLQERFADRPAGWKPLVYCWRGGNRSGAKPKQRIPKRENAFASVPPDIM